MNTQEFENYIKTLKQIHYLTLSMQNTSSVSEMLNIMLDECISITNAISGSVMFRHAQSDQLYFFASKNIDESIIKNTKMNIQDGIAGTVIHTGIPKIINNISLDPKYLSINDQVKSELAVPLKIENYTIGVIVLDHSQTDVFTDKHLEFIQMIAAQTSFIISYFLEKAYSEKYLLFLETFFKFPHLTNSEEIFNHLASILKVSGACIMDQDGNHLFSYGTLQESVDLNESIFEKSTSIILETKNPQNVPYTRLMIPRTSKDLIFVADKCYYFSDNTALDILFSDKVLELLSRQDPSIYHDSDAQNLIETWINKKILAPSGEIYDIAISEIERALIIKALEHNKNNKFKTAHFLGINRNTLRNKMEQFNLD